MDLAKMAFETATTINKALATPTHCTQILIDVRGGLASLSYAENFMAIRSNYTAAGAEQIIKYMPDGKLYKITVEPVKE